MTISPEQLAQVPEVREHIAAFNTHFGLVRVNGSVGDPSPDSWNRLLAAVRDAVLAAERARILAALEVE